jgi:hypothetical protein
MNDSRDLLIWQQGLLEYVDLDSITLEQAKVLLKGIKDHMDLLVTKVTPVRKITKQEKTDENAKDILDRYKKIVPDPTKWILPNNPVPYWPRPDEGWDKKFWLSPGYEMKPGEVYC